MKIKIKHYYFYPKDIIYVSEIRKYDTATKYFEIGLQGGHVLNIQYSIWEFINANDYWHLEEEQRKPYEEKAERAIQYDFDEAMKYWNRETNVQRI